MSGTVPRLSGRPGAMVPFCRDPGEPRWRRVALLLQGDDNYGVGRICREIATLLPGIRCVAMNQGVECELLGDLGVPVHVLPSGSYFRGFSPNRGLLGAVRQIARARPRWRQCAIELHGWARSHGVQILHGNVFAHYFTLVALRQSYPGAYRTIWHVHNYLNVERHLGLSARFVWRQARRGADRIACVSHAMSVGWAGSLVPVRVIHNGSPPRQVVAAAGSGRAPGRPLRLVACGRMEWSKGLHVAVEAAALARDAGVALTLDLCGGPLDANPYFDSIRRRIRELRLGSVVRALGYVDDLAARLHGYDLALQCRIDPEPCSVYVIECMHAGVALVASANGGTPELLRGGQDGWLYPPADATSLADGIIALARDVHARERLASSARARARVMFTPERFAERWAALYGELARLRSAGAEVER